MLNNKVAIVDAPVPALTPGMLASIRKEDMKQAIVERFQVRVKAAAPRIVARAGQRSPYWQPTDEEC
jgi:hypothetical protein